MSFFTQGDRVIQKFSKTRYIKSITFVVAFLEATFSPILPEAFLAVVLAYRKDISWKLLSVISAFGSACGAIGMYILGVTLYEKYGQALLGFLHGEHLAEKAKILFEENSFTAQFVASLTPLPDRVFSFLAGAFLISPLVIFFATFLGRLVRIAPIAYLSYEYGDEARVYIKKHTKLAVMILLVVVVLYGAYKYFS